ncbi:MAG: FAD-dependent oxidoreductase [Planctomycetales bacterium]|nr:FAD-dependent oxidoreductase [Planctomycetales bacterium]
MLNRAEMIERLSDTTIVWDMLVIGGGATGVGIAIDAASRGYRVALVEGSDFGKGTSSRSTKLIHGGVRYLQQGHLSLVFEALRERGRLRQNAPHLVSDLELLVPTFGSAERWKYRVGLKLYDLLAGRLNFGASRWLSCDEAQRRIPTLRTEGLRGAVLYHDGQFDDARLLIAMACTAAEQGATLANYVSVVRLAKSDAGQVNGAHVLDHESGREWMVQARVVINATGPFADSVRAFDDPTSRPMIAPSQGIHLVLDRDFLPGDAALLVPKTRDGRLMFAIPWHNATLIGTTDTQVDESDGILLEPKARDDEIDFLLETTAGYLTREPTRRDIRSVFAGIRPLVRSDMVKKTAKLARDHVIRTSTSGLVTIAGGKWTTYRHMAEKCVDQAAKLGGLAACGCRTHDLPLHGATDDAPPRAAWRVYGTDAALIGELAAADSALAEMLHPRLSLTAAEVVWAARHEMARTVDDVLARRSRGLLLDASAAIEAAPSVANWLSRELGRDAAWQAEQVRAFTSIAADYSIGNGAS